MGCWSESCAISGLEIGDQDEAVVLLLKPVDSDSYSEFGAFCRFTPLCAPTYGIYSDYGDIEDELPKDNEFFTSRLDAARRHYDPKSDSHMTYMNNMWWCRKDVWDFCDSIQLEFSYGDRPKTVGDAVVAHHKSIMKYVNDLLQEDDAEDTEDSRLRRLMKGFASGRDIFGLGYIDGKFVTGLKMALDDAIEHKNHEAIENIVEMSTRVRKLSMICHELRKIVCPSTRIGPQHGGYEAISQLATFTLTKCQEYFADCGED